MTNPKNQPAGGDARKDGIPDPSDKPHLDSGIDSNNVTFSDASLLDAKDDDWDIPSLSFPVIEGHGDSDAKSARSNAAPDIDITAGSVPATPSAIPSGALSASPSAIPSVTPDAAVDDAATTVLSTPIAPDTGTDTAQTTTTPASPTPTSASASSAGAMEPPSPPAQAFSDSATVVLPPINVNVPVPGQETAATTAMPAVSASTASTRTAPAQGVENLEDVSDEPTEPEDLTEDEVPSTIDGEKPKRSSHKPLVIGIAAVVLIAAVGGGAYAFVRHQQQVQHDTAFAACQTANGDATKANNALNAALKKAETAAATPVDQVTDATTISKLQSVVSSASGAGKVSACDASLSTAELNNRTQTNMKLVSTVNSHTAKVTAAVKAVTDSQDAKTAADVQTAKGGLQTAVNDAQTLLADSEGEVTDDATRQALQAAIDSANQLIANNDAKLDDVNKALTAIQDATSQVNDSRSAYTAILNRRRSSTSSNTGTGTGSNRYRNTNGSGSTAGSGSGTGAGTNGAGSGAESGAGSGGSGSGSGSGGSGASGSGSGTGSGSTGADSGAGAGSGASADSTADAGGAAAQSN